MSKKLLAVFVSLILGGIGIVAPVQATTTSPSISIDDETPVADQRVYLFMEDLEPNTEYSYGYMFAIGDLELFFESNWVPHFGIIGNFTTDSSGSAIESFNWFWQSNNEYDIYSAVFPSSIFVSEAGVTPTSLDDVLAKTNTIYPGQNIDLGTVSITGSGVGENSFIAGGELEINFDNFGSQYEMVEISSVPDLEIDNATDIWTIFYQGQAGIVGIPYIFDQNGDLSVTTNFPDNNNSAYLLFALYNNDMNDHRGTWFVTDIHGNIEPFVDLQGVYDLPESVRPYTYFQAFDENVHSDYYLNVESELSCSTIGGFVLFYAPGTCDWTITDESENVLFEGSVAVSKSADINAAAPLDHKTVTFKAGSSLITKTSSKLIKKMASDYEGLNVLLNGYSWKEGTVKKMKKLSTQRGLRVSNLFDFYEMSTWLVVGFGNQKPIYKTGSKQSLNRRVEIIVIPSDVL